MRTCVVRCACVAGGARRTCPTSVYIVPVPATALAVFAAPGPVQKCFAPALAVRSTCASGLRIAISAHGPSASATSSRTEGNRSAPSGFHVWRKDVAALSAWAEVQASCAQLFWRAAQGSFSVWAERGCRLLDGTAFGRWLDPCTVCSTRCSDASRALEVVTGPLQMSPELHVIWHYDQSDTSEACRGLGTEQPASCLTDGCSSPRLQCWDVSWPLAAWLI